MSERGPHISEDRARELWQRAAELQAAAERSRLLRPASPASSHELSLADVAAAAEGAGIDADFVRLALAEQSLPDAEEIHPDRPAARWARRVVGGLDALQLEQPIAAPPDRVYAALRTIANQPAFAMVLESAVGDDVPHDSVLTFRLSGDSKFHSELDFADARVVLATMRPTAAGTLLRLRAPLFRRGVNLGLSVGLSGFGGVAGWGAGAGVGGALAGMAGLGATLLFVPAALGAVAGGTVGLIGYRSLYNGVARGGTRALQRFIGAVELEARSATPPDGG